MLQQQLRKIWMPIGSMGSTDREEELELLGTAGFVDENWINAFGQVSAANALDYFARSPFYDEKCNNEVVRGRNLELDVLLSMKGVEYRLQRTQHEAFYIVIKQFRCSPTIVRKLGIYYILDNRIYRAPTLKQVVLSRVAQCCMHLQNALESLNHAFASQYAHSPGSAIKRDHITSSQTYNTSKRVQHIPSQSQQQLGQLQQSGPQPHSSSISSSSINNTSHQDELALPTSAERARNVRRKIGDQSLEKAADRDMKMILRSLVHQFLSLDELEDSSSSGAAPPTQPQPNTIS